VCVCMRACVSLCVLPRVRASVWVQELSKVRKISSQLRQKMCTVNEAKISMYSKWLNSLFMLLGVHIQNIIINKLAYLRLYFPLLTEWQSTDSFSIVCFLHVRLFLKSVVLVACYQICWSCIDNSNQWP
jgi:hypothetical protein